MKLKDMNKEELELLSYTDLTEMILKENNKSMNTPSIFKIICELLELSEEDYANKIGDYYTSLTTDKRFLLLDNAEWDLRTNHKVQIIVDEEDEEDEEIEEEETEEVEESEEIDELDDIDDENNDDDLVDDDDMDDLNIITDEELEEE